MPFKKDSKCFKCCLDFSDWLNLNKITFRLVNNCVPCTVLALDIYQRENLWHKHFKSQTAHPFLRSSPAYARSTSCTAWQPDRWPDLLGSSMAMGWSHPGARGSGDRSGNHGDSAGSSSRCHPDGYPARFRRLSAEDTGAGRVTITHMTNASPPRGKGRRGRRRGGDGVNWWACFACRSAEYM